MKRWDLLQTFVYVVDSGSFSAAAKRLGVSKSLVSRKITQLEKHLGTQLLFRTTRQLNTTDAGYTLFLKCERLFSNLEEAEQSVLNLEDVPRGHLRIVCTDILGERYISLAAAKFSSIHPQLKIDIHVTSRLVDLVAEGYDLAVRYGKLTDSSLKARQVMELPHLVCASPAYFKKYGKPKKIEDLKKHNCLVATFDPCTSWKFKVDKQAVDVDLQGNWRSNNASALITASTEGLGICRLPELYVRDHIKKGSLISIFDKYQYDSFPVWLVYPNTRYVSAKVRMFIDYFSDNIKILSNISTM
ncbi:MAG: LysR family transcriptional regulator [Gammaproteobacteria bacterium]|jgi:DNA-binding transcriptional LysR family regulator|nr:LysR family transcriptional regulator [Gammaproteobacteria bacterium]